MSSPEQALQSSCELLREIMIFKVKEMHASSCKCMPAYGPAFKLMELMKAHVTEYKLMKLHGSFCNCMLVFCNYIKAIIQSPVAKLVAHV